MLSFACDHGLSERRNAKLPPFAELVALQAIPSPKIVQTHGRCQIGSQDGLTGGWVDVGTEVKIKPQEAATDDQESLVGGPPAIDF